MAGVRGIDLESEEFKGKNGMSTMALYYYRLLYSATFSGTGTGRRDVSKSVRCFEFGERMLYGRVDPDMMPIQVKDEVLVTLQTSDPAKVCRVLPFVSLAFSDFQNAFRNAKEKGQISKEEGFMTFPEPKKAYISPARSYMDYRVALFELFVERMREDKDRNVKITSFETFLPHLEQYVFESVTRAPFTFSGYMRSKYSSIYSTGLAIDLLELNAAIDKRKVEMVYDNPNYPFYENMALQFGFSIDKNVPWRLVADLKSPAMQRYIERAGYANFRTALRSCYRSTYLDGYNNFKSLFVMYYNSFVGNNPSVASPKLKKNGKYVGRRTFRRQEDLVKLNLKYGEEWFLEKYALVRNAEEGSPLSEQRVKQLVSRANRLGKIKGKAKCLQMINKSLARTDLRSGSVTEKSQNKLEKKKKQEDLDLREQRKPGSLGY